MSAEIGTATLKEQIDAFQAQVMAQAPPEVIAALGRELQALADTGIASGALKVGEVAPDFALPDAAGRERRLSTVLAQGPVVLTFYRGGWCPYCNLQLRAFQHAHPRIRALGAQLVAVSPQTPDNSLSFARKAALEFPVLSDAGNRAARAYGLVFKLSDKLQELQRAWGNELPRFNGDESWELPMPGTFVLDRAGVARLAFVDPDYTRRLEPQAVLDALAALG